MTPRAVRAGLCGLCGRTLDQPDQPDTRDCGGDCLRCMAEAGDPEAVVALLAITTGDAPPPSARELADWAAWALRRAPEVRLGAGLHAPLVVARLVAEVERLRQERGGRGS